MTVNRLTRGGFVGGVTRWASRLRFPYLLLVTAVLFVFNVFVPDAIPMVDELIMGLATALLLGLKKKPEAENPP